MKERDHARTGRLDRGARRGVWLAAIVALVAVGYGGGGCSSPCKSGDVEPCTCSDGTSGTTTCQADGTLGTCNCSTGTGGSCTQTTPQPAPAACTCDTDCVGTGACVSGACVCLNSSPGAVGAACAANCSSDCELSLGCVNGVCTCGSAGADCYCPFGGTCAYAGCCSGQCTALSDFGSGTCQ